MIYLLLFFIEQFIRSLFLQVNLDRVYVAYIE